MTSTAPNTDQYWSKKQPVLVHFPPCCIRTLSGIMMSRVYWWFSDFWWYNTLVLAYINGENFSLFHRGIYFADMCPVISVWGRIQLSWQGALPVCEFWHSSSFCCVDLGYFGPKIKKHKHYLNSLYGRVTSSPEGCNCNFLADETEWIMWALRPVWGP